MLEIKLELQKDESELALWLLFFYCLSKQTPLMSWMKEDREKKRGEYKVDNKEETRGGRERDDVRKELFFFLCSTSPWQRRKKRVFHGVAFW